MIKDLVFKDRMSSHQKRYGGEEYNEKILKAFSAFYEDKNKLNTPSYESDNLSIDLSEISENRHAMSFEESDDFIFKPKCNEMPSLEE